MLIVSISSCSDGKKPNSGDSSNSTGSPKPATTKTHPYDYFNKTNTTAPESTTLNGGDNNPTVNNNNTTTSKPSTTTTTKTTPTERPTARITIPEGKTHTEIFKLLSDNGVGTYDGLMKAAKTYDYNYYPLIAAIPSNDRIFKLEGYLFPDTYDFYKGTTDKHAQDALGVMFRNGKAKITDAHKQKAAALGFTIDQIITIASMIEKEGAKSSEVKNISAVFHNRLNQKWKLQMDSTFVYLERMGYRNNEKYEKIYNTYNFVGLPAGPISNPGIEKINAALSPADVPYMFFCHDKNAKYYYAVTNDEHNVNVAEMKKVNAQ